MTKEIIKNNVRHLPNALFVISVVFIILTVIKVSGYAGTSERITKAIDTAKSQNGHDEETVKELLGKTHEGANKLKQKNMFVPPPPKARPPVCLGIIGDKAIINNKYYKVGDKIGPAELIAVGTKDVTIKWEDKEMKLVPFAQSNKSPDGDSRPGPKPSGDNGKNPDSKSATTTVVNQGPEQGMRPGMDSSGGRSGFMNMSSEEREAMIARYRSMSPEEQSRFRDERRREMMERGGGRGGFGDRGDRGGRGDRRR